MADQKSGSSRFLIYALLGLIVLGGLYYFALGQQKQSLPQPEPVAQEQAESVTKGTSEEIVAEDEIETPGETTNVDVAFALKERIMGDPSAPLKISEHSSFTCGHCGVFHKSTFKQVKENYIDTGKAYLVFSDFPLNAPALHASITARCIPDEGKYFQFAQTIFEEQEKWAYDVGYLTFLRNKAAEYGLDNKTFEACLAEPEIQKGIIERMKASQEQWQIAATPSFVLNNQRTISGAYSYEDFKKILDEELAKIEESQGE